MNTLFLWIHDYVHMIQGHVITYLYQHPPRSYTEYVPPGKPPIIFIPGFFEGWGFFKSIADQLSIAGYPVYIVTELGNNLQDVPLSAAIVKKRIDKEHLKNVILIGHSKGGLIGKYILSFLNADKRVVKLIAIATPFSGSSLARFMPFAAFKDIQPEDLLIKDLLAHTSVNRMIVSIAPKVDNHIISPSGSFVEGAKNITLPVTGHHALLFDPKLIDVVLEHI